jgi:hypothetical protein
MKHSIGWISVSLLAVLVGCGKPMDPSGGEAQFVKASMVGPTSQGADRPLAADLAVEPISMLVMFNRLKTPDKLQDALNKKPGQFSHLDLDKDGTPDPLTVAAAANVSDGHGFEIRVRPNSGEYVVATMIFDPEWTYLGHYSGLKGGAASTVGRPLLAAAPTGAAAPMPVATAPTPTAVAAGVPAPVVAPASGVATPASGVGTPAPAVGAAPGSTTPAPGVGTPAPAVTAAPAAP